MAYVLAVTWTAKPGNEDEIQGILKGTNVPAIEVCAMVQEHSDSPAECRKMLKFMMDYLERAEVHADAKRSHEIHEAIHHFVSNHRIV